MKLKEWKKLFLEDRDLAIELYHQQLTSSQQGAARRWMAKNGFWFG